MTDPFRLEAEYYDRIWGLGDRYKAEAEFLDKILKRHKAHRILDLGCGTGGHCLELAKLGYDVVGLDASETMLEGARKKLSEAGTQSCFVLGDMTEVRSVLRNAKIPPSFDAVISMGYSFAHLSDDQSLIQALEETRSVLKQEGMFIFCVRNAKQLRDDLIRQLRLDTILNEPELQLALLCYNFRDQANPDILVWNTLWLINERGNTNFQVRTHPLRWFRYDELKTILESYGYAIIHTYGDTLGQEEFDINRHDTIFMTTQKR